MNPAWLLLIVPVVAVACIGLGLAIARWDRFGGEAYGSPEDPFRQFFPE